MAKIKEIIEVEDLDLDRKVWFVIEAQGKDFEWNAHVPKDGKPLDHLNAALDSYLLLILKRMYPGARPDPPEMGRDHLSAFKAWIAAGHTNSAGLDGDGNILKEAGLVKRVPFKSTHPPELKFRKAYRAATTDSARIKILAKAVFKIMDG